MSNFRPWQQRGARQFLAELKESFFMAMDALRSHKLRSALTLLGVLIGVFSIIVVMTAMRVLQRDMEKELRGLGSHTFQVQKWPAVYFGGPDGFEKYWRRKNITLAQGKDLKARASLPANVGFQFYAYWGEMNSRYEQSAPAAALIGVTPEVLPAKNLTIAEGRSLLESDVDGGYNVCVIGNGMAKSLFPHGSPVGDQIKVDGINYSIVGTLEPQGGMLGGDQDNFVLIPISTGLDRYGRHWRSISILVQCRDALLFDDTVEQVRGVLRVLRKVPPGQEDDFEIFSNDSVMAQIQTVTRAVRIGVAAVSSIALIAAGIGIMNIMLVSVTERTREIGLRRAIGAKRRSIMSQFIFEAIVLCQIGGAVGVVLGILGGNLTAYFFKVMPVIPFDWVLFGLAICSIVGVIFGSYPAYKAAHLDPIEALRYE